MRKIQKCLVTGLDLVEGMFYLIYFFPTPPIELKLGLQIGGRLLPLATYLHQSLWLPNQKSKAVVIIFSTLFCSRCPALLCLSPASRDSSNMHGQNYFADPNQHFTVHSERYSQIWLKSSCRWSPTHLPHKFGKKRKMMVTSMLQALVCP